MRRAAIAESVLSLLTNREHASAIIGDLLEGSLTTGSFWFWSSFARTAFALSWRAGLGLLATACSAAVMIWAFNESARAPHGVGRLGVLFGWCATLLLMTAVRSAFKYGLHDPMTILSSTLGLAASCGVWFRWVPLFPLASAALAACIAISCSFTAHWRKTISALSIVVLESGIGGVVLMGLCSMGLSAAGANCGHWVGAVAMLFYYGGQALMVSITLDRTRSAAAHQIA